MVGALLILLPLENLTPQKQSVGDGVELDLCFLRVSILFESSIIQSLAVKVGEGLLSAKLY